jgi:hypothetical protein
MKQHDGATAMARNPAISDRNALLISPLCLAKESVSFEVRLCRATPYSWQVGSTRFDAAGRAGSEPRISGAMGRPAPSASFDAQPRRRWLRLARKEFEEYGL